MAAVTFLAVVVSSFSVEDVVSWNRLSSMLVLLTTMLRLMVEVVVTVIPILVVVSLHQALPSLALMIKNLR
jgi:hypothetical protein